jgi:hypothetical protein
VNGINERDIRARAEEACGQVRKTQGPIFKSCSDKAEKEGTTPGEPVVGIILTDTRQFTDRGTIVQSLVDTSAHES